MFGFGKKKNTTPTPSVTDRSSSKTLNPDSSSKVILEKATVSLEKKISLLKEQNNVDLSNHKARVFVVLDRSGSMDCLFKNGEVQAVLTRLLPLALKFDDNGELEVYLFNNSYIQVTPMSKSNYEHYVDSEIMQKGLGPSGGTSYSPVIEFTTKTYNDGTDLPAFGIFITDGANNDESQTDLAIRDSSKTKIFFQFIGIGYEDFLYLQKLDDLSGRTVDNTAFVKVSDFASLSDDQLYDKLLEQYPQWLKDMGI